jgi:hypothetical protein
MANIVTTSRINVRVSNTSSTLLNSSVPVTLKNNPVITVGDRTLESLDDVLVVDKASGSTLAYSANTNKYEIKQLTLDGGTF